MSANSNGTELTLTITFGCLATMLALAGIVVACVQCRSNNRASHTTSSPSNLETGLPLTPIVSGRRSQERGESDSVPKANDGQLSSTCSDAGAARTQDGHGSVEIACGFVQSVASA
jgi:hypothetical protein